MLLKKLFNVSFTEVRVAERRPFGLGDLHRYPLFTPEFLEGLRRWVPEERHARLVHSIVVTARRPEAGEPPTTNGA